MLTPDQTGRVVRAEYYKQKFSAWTVHQLSECGIYLIRCTVNGKVYVGSTKVSFAYRWKSHLQTLVKGNNYCCLLQRAFNKYGESAFEFEILEVIPKESKASLFLQREGYWIKRYDSCSDSGGYNVIGVDENGNLIFPKSLIQRIAEKTRKTKRAKKIKKKEKDKPPKPKSGGCGRKVSEETRKKLSEASKRQWSSEEHRREMSEKMRGKKFSSEVRKKMSESAKRRPHEKWTEERKKRVSEKVKMQFDTGERVGIPRSEETKRKMSESQSKKNYEVTKPDGSKVIIRSLRKFCRENGLVISNAFKAKKLGKYYKGYFFRDLDCEPRPEGDSA